MTGPRSRLTLLGTWKENPKNRPPPSTTSSTDYDDDDSEMADYDDSDSECSVAEITPEQALRSACRKSLSDSFTLNPTAGILSRRAANPALKQAWQPILEPTLNDDDEDYDDDMLETPEYQRQSMDSGYLSHQSTTSPLSTRRSSAGIASRPAATLKPLGATTIPTPYTIRAYQAKMHAQSEALLMENYIKPHFTYDSRGARKALKPVMRRCLDRPQDMKKINKFYLHLDFKKSTIRGEHRTARKRFVDMKQRRYEGDDYFTVKGLP